MRKLIGWGLIIVAISLALAFWHVSILAWLAYHTGVTSPTNTYTTFWGNFGSDLGEVTLLAALVGGYRHHNCHVKGCLRLGRPVEGTPYVACPKHHPEHEGKKRAISLEVLHRAHRMRQYR
jgi:hypothetical protein